MQLIRVALPLESSGVVPNFAQAIVLDQSLVILGLAGALLKV